MFTTWGYKIRMSKAFAIGTADGDRHVGVLYGFSGATRLAAQPKGQKNNPPAIALCKTISPRPYCAPICTEETDAIPWPIRCGEYPRQCSGCASCL